MKKPRDKRQGVAPDTAPGAARDDGGTGGTVWHGFAPAVGRASEEVVRAGDRAWGPPPEGLRPEREVSRAEREGISSTEPAPVGPMGVGVSETRSPEKLAARKRERGRRTVGVDERTGRPYGTSGPEDATGVAPQGTADEESPYLPPGDQAG
ncbi:hypothetical protein [Streptosporangium pseudovulgare]|uniref:hypothetical protein n=1 Tax=Streptosporangium pseudovulgare TaxID=35765 RepID=UPI0016701CCE|nr:hypothetical protein [Streptosporangium pseudovulgare]